MKKQQHVIANTEVLSDKVPNKTFFFLNQSNNVNNLNGRICADIFALGAVHIYQHFHKCTKGTLFLTPLPHPQRVQQKMLIL